jgi:fatty acid desaturase
MDNSLSCSCDLTFVPTHFQRMTIQLIRGLLGVVAGETLHFIDTVKKDPLLSVCASARQRARQSVSQPTADETYCHHMNTHTHVHHKHLQIPTPTN